jgi:hypothetical protein
MESNMTRDKIDVEVSYPHRRGGGLMRGQVRNLSLTWERRGRGIVKDLKKVILDDVSVRFPGQ